MGRLLLLFFIFTFLFSCGNGTPEGILPKETMVPLLTDLHIANGYATSLYAPENAAKVTVVYKAIYKKYSIDSVGLRRNLEYYTKRPEEMQLIYLQVEKRMMQIEKEEQSRYARQQKEDMRKIKLEEEMERRKKRFVEFRLNFAKGKYNFGESYKTPAHPYLKPWKRPRTSQPNKIDSAKTDSVKTRL